jgi:hypothetical protein
MQGLQSHDELGRRAIGIGDDIAALGVGQPAIEHRAIHFRHDQWNVRVIAPVGRVIDDDATGRGDARGPFLGDRAAGRHDGEIDALEVEIVEVLRLQNLVAIGNFPANRPGRGQCDDLIGGELAFGQNIENFPAHIARGTDDSDAITHFGTPVPCHFRPARWHPSRSVLLSLSPAGR